MGNSETVVHVDVGFERGWRTLWESCGLEVCIMYNLGMKIQEGQKKKLEPRGF